jgi:hypothetical protein
VDDVAHAAGFDHQDIHEKPLVVGAAGSYRPNSRRSANRSGKPAAMIFAWLVATSYSTR